MTIRLFFSASLRKKVSHEGAKARSRKMLRIFLCAFESLWLNSIFYKIEFQPFKILVISSLSKAGSQIKRAVSKWPRFRQAANDKYFKRLINNFLQKLNLATKTRRHKGKCVAFFYLVPLRLCGKPLFAAKLRKKFSFVICKELKFFFYECLTLTILLN